MNTLSTREQEVCALIVRGVRPKEIAQHCGISVNTARQHCVNIHRKLGVQSDLEVVALVLSTRIEKLRHALGEIVNEPCYCAGCVTIAKDALAVDS